MGYFQIILKYQMVPDKDAHQGKKKEKRKKQKKNKDMLVGNFSLGCVCMQMT